VAELAVQLAKFSAWPPVIWERRVRTAAPSLPAFAGNVPDKSFLSGNDIYQWRQTDKTLAQGYVVCMYDMAAHAAYSIDGMRHFGAMPNNDAEVEFALDRVVDCRLGAGELIRFADIRPSTAILADECMRVDLAAKVKNHQVRRCRT
jgi:hypothetical protein